MHSVCVVELHVTDKYIKILGVSQQCLYVGHNNELYVGLHVQCAMLH
jgi:hypothetical protein